MIDEMTAFFAQIDAETEAQSKNNAFLESRSQQAAKSKAVWDLSTKQAAKDVKQALSANQ